MKDMIVGKLNRISDLLNEAFLLACQIEDEKPEIADRIKAVVCNLLLDVELDILRENIKGE